MGWVAQDKGRMLFVGSTVPLSMEGLWVIRMVRLQWTARGYMYILICVESESEI